MDKNNAAQTYPERDRQAALERSHERMVLALMRMMERQACLCEECIAAREEARTAVEMAQAIPATAQVH